MDSYLAFAIPFESPPRAQPVSLLLSALYTQATYPIFRDPKNAASRRHYAEQRTNLCTDLRREATLLALHGAFVCRSDHFRGLPL